MKALHIISYILLVVGGLNWLLVGINPSWDVVAMIFGAGSGLSNIVYILVGVSAIYQVATHKKSCRHCSNGGMM